jgi:hypothetical protein
MNNATYRTLAFCPSCRLEPSPLEVFEREIEQKVKESPENLQVVFDYFRPKMDSDKVSDDNLHFFIKQVHDDFF